MKQPTRRVFDETDAAAFRSVGWWSEDTLADTVAEHATAHPGRRAYVGDGDTVTWLELDRASTGLARLLVACGVRPRDHVAVWQADTPALHLTYLAVEKAGAVIVGVGARAGAREVAHLLAVSGASTIITDVGHRAEALTTEPELEGVELRQVSLAGNAAELEIAVDGTPAPLSSAPPIDLSEGRLGPDEIFLINSTSGTTGMPKCVVHTLNRWHYFHQKAAENGQLDADDVFLSVVPAPFGFGLWTSHVTPIILGVPTVVMERFSPEVALAAIERHRVTVLSCVSTQFIMMLSSTELGDYDLSSLRVTFTGGEAVPFERAAKFERSTGATILQFYGSNETGLLSGTTLQDSVERRLETAGRIVDEMQVRLFDDGRDCTDRGWGQPGCKGPATSLGYLGDPAANDELFTDDGWMLMGDLCEIDDEGYLTVIGRISDVIIRGGKNISAAQVEAEASQHPSIAHAAAVSMPDDIFGERVCLYAELTGDHHLELADLLDHLSARGVSKELFPERLVVLDSLPRSSGAKVAKGVLRDDIRRRLGAQPSDAIASNGSAPRKGRSTDE